MKKGWKVFDKNLQCQGFQFEVGKTFKETGELRMCANGFHFHENKEDLFNYKGFNSENRVCEVQSVGKTETGSDKSACLKIKIIRELTWHEVLSLINIGKDNIGRNNSGNSNSGNSNSGNSNSGDSNSGNSNSGDSNSGYSNSGNSNSGDSNSGNSNSGDSNSGNRNSGYSNSGDSNSGDSNSGYSNSGDSNSGNSNSGDSNSGYSNSGNSNSGDFNSCKYSSGIFNSKSDKIRMFNKKSDWTLQDWHNSEAHSLSCRFQLNIWIWEEDMSDEEKKEQKDFHVRGGYLKTYSYEEACQNWWNELSKEERQIFFDLPNFNKKVFKEITGIKS